MQMGDSHWPSLMPRFTSPRVTRGLYEMGMMCQSAQFLHFEHFEKNIRVQVKCGYRRIYTPRVIVADGAIPLRICFNRFAHGVRIFPGQSGGASSSTPHDR